MKSQLTKLIFAATVFVFTITARASDRWETLRAIHWVENPTDQTNLGRFGELGPYQFRPATWRMHTKRPFSMAADRTAADEVAVLHYEWIKRTLEQSGVDPSTFNIALAWNCGVEAVVDGRVPDMSYTYAERVTNLVAALKARLEPMAVEAKPQPSRPLDLNLDDQSSELRFRVIQDAPRFVLAG
ncbi:MAG TPA: hypothetical protein VG936_13385 [Lacunisphaera sp.]|nr:hypothetical protein [Lacunisphaera sp.]